MSDGMRVEPSTLGLQRMEWHVPDGTSADSVSSGLGWAAGFFFAFRTVAVFISARWLDLGTEPGVLFTFAASAALLIVLVLQAFGPLAQPVRWMWKLATVRWVGLYLAFSGCSLLWTSAASPASSALYWCALAADVMIVLLVFRGSEPDAAAHSLMKGFVWGACILATIAWMIPRAEDLRLGDLDYFNTNQIGNICALAIFMCQILTARKQGKWRLTAVFLAITLFRSLSKATLVAFVASQAYRLVVDRAMSRRKKVLLVTCAAVVTLAFWGLIEAYVDIYSNAGNQAETLTGRTAIWAWALSAAMSRPWIGNGIDAMWKMAPPFGGELFEARHAENELLQQFFAYGLAGIVMLAGIYASLWRRFRRLGNVSDRSILISLLVFVLVRGVAEGEPFDLLLPLWMIMTITLLLGRRLSAEEFLPRLRLIPEDARTGRSGEVVA